MNGRFGVLNFVFEGQMSPDFERASQEFVVIKSSRLLKDTSHQAWK